MEEWRPIADWKDIYEVSNIGRVRRVVGGTSTYAGRILRPFVWTAGYLAVRLRFNGRTTKRYLHLFVAEAFLGRKPPKMDVNHKDGNRTNPKLSNLEYVTRSENHLHAYRVLGRKAAPSYGAKNGSAKLDDKSVSKIIRLYASGGITQKQLAVQFGVSQPAIGYIVRRKTWQQVTIRSPRCQ